MSQFSAVRDRLAAKASTPGRPRQITLAAVIAVVAGIAGLTWWALRPDPPRQREYVNASACLLTGERGVAGEPAKTVWSALQQASTATRVRVQYLPVTGTRPAEPYLNSLVAGRCALIVATGPAPIDAVTRSAGSHPTIEFLTVGGGTAATNVQVIDTAGLRGELDDRLQTLADATS